MSIFNVPTIFVTCILQTNIIIIINYQHRYDSCVRCVLDPYCGWDKEVGACRPYAPGLLHDATNSTPSICEASAPLKTVRAGYGQSVHLAAFGKTPEALKDQVVSWYHHSRERGRYKISYK